MRTLLSRRDALRLAGFTAAMVALDGAVVSMSGCTLTKAQLEAYAADVDAGAAVVAKALGANALAATIGNALSVFDQAVNAWSGGSVVADIVSASKILEIALGALGLPAELVAAADVVINVLDTILANLPVPRGAATNAAAPRVASAAQPANAPQGVRPRGARVYKSRKEAVADWNGAVAGTPLASTKFS